MFGLGLLVNIQDVHNTQIFQKLSWPPSPIGQDHIEYREQAQRYGLLDLA
jgi:hypothetical protein